MDDTDKEILKKLNDEMHNLNEKINDLSSKIERLLQQQTIQEKRDAEKIFLKEKHERQSNYCYALGGLAVTLASILLGLTQFLSYIFIINPEKFYFYLLGNGLILLSGILIISGGYQIAKYPNIKGNIKRVKIFGHQTKVLVLWKRDIPLLIATIFVLLGIFFLFLVALSYSPKI